MSPMIIGGGFAGIGLQPAKACDLRRRVHDHDRRNHHIIPTTLVSGGQRSARTRPTVAAPIRRLSADKTTCPSCWLKSSVCGLGIPIVDDQIFGHGDKKIALDYLVARRGRAIELLGHNDCEICACLKTTRTREQCDQNMAPTKWPASTDGQTTSGGGG